MYSYIRGTIGEITPDSITLENNGIGYHINSSASTISNIKDGDTNIKLFTHLYVREDIFSLYGFLTRDELKMFLLLISVSGVGPKAALSIMSTVSPSKFSLCVITDDSKALTRAQGIGNKLAQRIILDLKDKIKKESLEQHINMGDETPSNANLGKNIKEAIDALLVLGYTRDSAYNAVKNNYKDGLEVEDIIRNSLKSLAR